MKKIFSMLPLVVLLAAGCNSQIPLSQSTQNGSSQANKPSQNLNASTGSNAAPAQPQSKNAKTYTSAKLHLQFQYEITPHQVFTVVEKGNVVALCGSLEPFPCDQYVEVFTKAKTQSLADAVKAQFLSTYPNCVIVAHSQTELSLDIPGGGAHSDRAVPSEVSKYCPLAYTRIAGEDGFFADSVDSDRFVYYVLGQDPLRSSDDISAVPWAMTLKFTN